MPQVAFLIRLCYNGSMITEANGIEKDGDFLPPDSSEPLPLTPGIEVDDRPGQDAEPEVDDRPLEEEQRLRVEIKRLLLGANDWAEKAKSKGIHSTTRDKRNAKVRELVNQADVMIAELLGISVDSLDSTLPIASMRYELRKEALEERAAETEAKNAAELGRRAALTAQSGVDVQRLRANDRDED